MIDITKKISPCLIDIKIEGHAGYAAKGFDIVCASVSILYHTLYLALASEGTTSLDDATGEIMVKRTAKTDEIVEYFFKGFSAIAEAHPENVGITTIVEG